MADSEERPVEPSANGVAELSTWRRFVKAPPSTAVAPRPVIQLISVAGTDISQTPRSDTVTLVAGATACNADHVSTAGELGRAGVNACHAQVRRRVLEDELETHRAVARRSAVDSRKAKPG